MKVGLFSDVHSNLEAFERVLDSLKREKVQQYFFLGDLVGYGASPKECIGLLKELIKSTGCRCIAGNHDHAVAGLTRYDHYAFHAKEAIDWTKKMLKPVDLEFLAGLPLLQGLHEPIIREAASKLDFTIVHANLSSPEEWGYLWDIDDADLTFKLLKKQICFIGHSHKPIVFTSGAIVDWFISEHIVIEKNLKYIINVGSVGQPRDGNPKACYAVYDSDRNTVEIKRVEYDIKKTQSKILAAGLPSILADRLALGK